MLKVVGTSGREIPRKTKDGETHERDDDGLKYLGIFFILDHSHATQQNRVLGALCFTHTSSDKKIETFLHLTSINQTTSLFLPRTFTLFSALCLYLFPILQSCSYCPVTE